MIGAGGVDDDPIGRTRSDDGCEAPQQGRPSPPMAGSVVYKIVSKGVIYSPHCAVFATKTDELPHLFSDARVDKYAL
jgi:hypothetical protein